MNKTEGPKTLPMNQS